MDHNDGPTPTAHPAPRIPELPLEVLSNIASLLAPPFYPPDPITGHDLVHHLDPAPQPSLTHINQIALVCRSAHALLEPSRPWLWEHLDIRSGRGWLAVVNALTEEIMDDDGDDESPDRDKAGESSIVARTPGAVKQERAANTAAKVAAAMQGLAVTNMNGGPSAPSILSPTASTAPSTGVPYAADGYFTAEPPLETYPGLPEGSSSLVASTSANTTPAFTTRGSVPAPIGIPVSPPVYTTSQQQAIYSYSPPQPERVSLLLTPTVSRDPSASSSGSVSTMRDPNAIRSSSIILPPKASPGLGSASGSGASRLRGRSRSPRRSIGFITEGIESVLQRSRSTSSHHQPQQQLHQQHRSDLSSPANAYSAWGRRPSLAFDGRPSFGRATSLSWSRTYADLSDGEADGDDATGGDDADGDYAGGSGFEPSALNPISILDKGKGKASPFGFDYDITNQNGAETLFDRMGDPILRARSTSPSARSVIEPMERHVSPPMPSHDSLLVGVDSADHTMMEDEHWLNCNPELLPPPGPYIRHLSFTNFRTIGSRRTQDEAVRGRFVTAGRLEGVIKNAPNLVSVCMTEYVDSALSYEVVEELFFRGTKRPRRARRMSENRGLSLSRIRSMSVPSSPQNHIDQLDPPRPTYAPYEDETEDEKWKRRGMFTPLEALDLTGCISVTFQHAIDEFWHTFYAPDEGVHEGDEEDDEHRGRSRSRSTRRGAVPGSMTGSESGGMVSATDTEAETEDESRAGSSAGLNGYFTGAGRRMSSRRRAPVFSGLKRLSLRNCLHIESHILDGLLRSFPCLTHLDLSGTKVPSRFLASLIDKAPRTLRLESLSLARCPRIDPHVVVEFLCRSPAAKDLKELNLFVNPSQGNPIRGDDLMRLITTAPCFRSGKLRYLDISSSHLSAAHLALGVFPPQPELICLGLSHMPSLNLEPISDFILNQAPNVEILTIVGTAFEHNLRPTHSALQLTLQLHSKLINPCTAEPFSLSLSLRPLDPNLPKDPGPTRLRVIELASWIRKAIGPAGGSHMWKNIRSKGGRGWYVDITAAWVQDTTEEGKKWRYARYLPHIHPWRMFLQGLSDAGGRVSSSVGWHSRKMEVIQGWGMMGREEGLAGAGAFAYEDQ